MVGRLLRGWVTLIVLVVPLVLGTRGVGAQVQSADDVAALNQRRLAQQPG
jgi:hypothetical protein